jgi:hypothetical protein
LVGWVALACIGPTTTARLVAWKPFVVVQPILKAPIGHVLEERPNQQFPVYLSYCRSILHTLVQRLHAWKSSGDTALSWSSLPTSSHPGSHLFSPFNSLIDTQSVVASTAAHGPLASSTSFRCNADGSSCPTDGNEVQRGAPSHRPRIRGRRPRFSGADQHWSRTGVDSAVAGRDQASRHGNSQGGHGRSSRRRDSIGGSLGSGGF